MCRLTRKSQRPVAPDVAVLIEDRLVDEAVAHVDLGEAVDAALGAVSVSVVELDDVVADREHRRPEPVQPLVEVVADRVDVDSGGVAGVSVSAHSFPSASTSRESNANAYL